MRLPRALARPRWPLAVATAAVLALAGLATPAGPAAEARAAEAGRAEIPDYVGYVNDRAAVLSEPRRAQLEAFLDDFAKKTGAQFAVLTLDSTAPEDPDAYKVRVFEAWGIGSKANDEGLLLLLAMEEHRIVFETGYGLEGTLPDGWQATMLRELAVPRIRAGDVEGGVTAAVLAAAQRVAAEKGVTLQWNGRELRYSSVERGRRLPLWAVALLIFLLVAIFSSVSRRGFRGPGPWIGGGMGGYGGYRGWGGGWGGGGGGFGGGSFGGFGGGGSGGGGGGASW